MPQLLSQVLPALSHDVEQVRQAAHRVNNALTSYIISLPEEPVKAAITPSASTPAPSQLPQPTANATRTNKEADGPERRESLPASRLRKSGSPEPVDGVKPRQEVQTPTLPALDKEEDEDPSPSQMRELDYEAAVNALTLQFLNEHEASRVAALSWLIMLHRKSPRKVCASS